MNRPVSQPNYHSGYSMQSMAESMPRARMQLQPRAPPTNHIVGIERMNGGDVSQSTAVNNHSQHSAAHQPVPVINRQHRQHPHPHPHPHHSLVSYPLIVSDNNRLPMLPQANPRAAVLLQELRNKESRLSQELRMTQDMITMLLNNMYQ